MNPRILVTCRLATLLEQKRVTPEELSMTSGLPLARIRAYCEGAPDAVSLAELGAILSALSCTNVAELFEAAVAQEAVPEDGVAPAYEADWYSPCPASPDGRHQWYKDAAVSDTVYQEFTCRACGRRLSVIL